MGRFCDTVDDDEELVELVVELLDDVGVGPTTVVRTCEKKKVLVCLSGPKPTEVDKTVVTTVLDEFVEELLFEEFWDKKIK